MPINLTGSQIKDTFAQLLHVDGGPAAGEKIVHSGAGVATAFGLGTVSASVGNVQFSANTVSTTNTDGNLVLAPNGTGSVSIAKAAITGGSITGITDLAVADGGTGASDAPGARTNLGLGTIATQDADDVLITGGAISNVSFTGSFNGITAITSTSFFTDNLAAGLTLTGNDLLADGTDANIDIDITPKGTGEVNLPKVDIDGGTVDGTVIGGTTAAAGAFTTLSASGAVTFSSGTINNIIIGGTTAAAATFTDLTASGTVNLSGATVSNGGTVTTVAINGGAINGTTLGATTASTVRATTVQATTSIGYPAGTGDIVTQLTSKSTGVTLNKICGRIIMNGAQLNRNTGVSFTLTNSFIVSTDVVIINIAAAATPSAYTVGVDQVVNGSCQIHLHNHLTGTDLTDGVTLNFAVIKAASS